MAEGPGANGKNGEDAFFEDYDIEDENVPTRRRQEMESLRVLRSPGNFSRGSPRPSEVTVDGNELYEAIRLGTKSIQDLVNDWILRYDIEQETAVLELLQCFINGAGCSVAITLTMIQTIPIKDLIKQVMDKDDFCDNVHCSLNTTDVRGRKFRTNFQEFLELLFRNYNPCVLINEQLLQRLVSFIKALAVSAKRSFRYTGTLIGMKLTTAMVETAAIFQKIVDRIDEGQGEGVGAGTGDPEMMEISIEFHKKLDDLFNSFFDTGLRYPDFSPEIRDICISELGLWIVKYPHKFLATKCLNHIGWHLSDEVLKVKISCIKTLQLLCDSPKFYSEKSGVLAVFVKRFKSRIVEMAYEMNSCTVPAINLLISVFKNLPNILTADDCKQVQELVYAPNSITAKTAGIFLMRNFKNATKPDDNPALMRRLIEFLILQDPALISYAVDSLFDKYPLMNDWECMAGLLLRAPAVHSDEVPFGDLELNTLIKLMVACFKQAATGETPEGRKSAKKDEKEVVPHQELLTVQFIPLMEKLLDKYARDSKKVLNLLIIPRFFKFSRHLQLPMKKNLEMLWKNVSDIVALHTDENVLEACSKIYEILWDSGHISEEAIEWIDGLINEYLASAIKYRKVMQKKENSVEVRNVTVCLKKLTCFYCHIYFDYGDRELFESLFFFATRGREWDGLPKDIAHFSITTCLHLLLQEFHKLYNVAATPEEKIIRLGEKLKLFMNELEFTISVGRVTLQGKGFSTACDLLNLFGKPFAGRTYLDSLVYEPTNDYKTVLITFIENHVFRHLASMYEVAIRQGFMSSFCNLIQQNIVGVRFAAGIFKNYLSFSRDYGDIIGETLKTAASINVVGTARTLVITLSELFTQWKDNTGKVDRRSPEFIAIKELAKKLSASFTRAVKVNYNQAIYALHSDGIVFAVSQFKNPEDPAGPLPNIAFLEILNEFSYKLTRNDKNKILNIFEKYFGSDKARDGEEWFGYGVYRRSLTARTLNSPVFYPR